MWAAQKKPSRAAVRRTSTNNMPLKEYKKKRDFSKTSEPSGEISDDFCEEIKKSHKIPDSRPIYVVQEHHARSLHFDLRLEFNGVLKSWAVPKGIPLKQEDGKRLAVETEDHPLEYATFAGTIPEGYGAGEVKIWDSGTFAVIDKSANKIIFSIKGKKAKGAYVLLKANFGEFAKSGKNWLLFRKKEDLNNKTKKPKKNG